MSRRLSRRSFLAGTGGAALCLPMLESMMPRSAVAGGGATPTRYVFCYAGCSSGRYRTPQEGEVLVPDAHGDLETVGAAMHSLQPLFNEGVGQDVSLVSNLLIPWGNSNLAPGGRLTDLDFHFGPTVTPQLSGLKALVKARMEGASSDQLMVQSMAPDTVVPSLSQRVQPIDYMGGNGGSAGRISFRDDGGSITPIDPFVSPRETFNFLNSVFLPPDASPEMLAAIERRASVLDEVGGAAQALMTRLGASDRERLQRHLHEVELLESQLRSGAGDISGACLGPMDPGEDPALGGQVAGIDELDSSLGWSDEDTRAQRQMELIRMAFSCDVTRFASLQMTNWKSWMGASNIGAGWDIDIHEIGHTGAMPKEAMGDVVGWHVGQFAKLVRMLKETPEWDGSSLLDNTALVLCFEGGHGEDPVDGGYSTHSTQNMSVLVAGNVGGLVAGQHIDGQERHPAEVTLTAMRAAGYGGDFGDFSSEIAGLRG